MYFEEYEKPTRATRSKKKTEKENKIIQPSQTGQVRLSKSKELVPGTVEENDDVIEILESPSPVKKKANASIFSRKPKQSSNLFDFDELSGSSRKVASRTREQNQTIKPKEAEKKVVKSPPRKKPSPQKKAAISKRAIESDSDDDFSFFEPKRSKQNQSTQKSETSNTNIAVTKVTKNLKNYSISNQLKTIESTVLKRASDLSQDDLFAFDTKKTKREEPKLRRKQKVSEISSSITPASISSNNSNVSTSSNIPLDLAPGREVGSSQWLSKESLVSVKKEEPENESEQQVSSASLDEPDLKPIFHIVPSTVNLNETVEVRGKSFKKKINYKPQTTVVATRDHELNDVNLLYPMAL